METLASGIQVGWGKQWDTLATALSDYYGGGLGYPQYEKVVQMLNSGEYTMEEMESILGQIPEFSRTYNANGELVGVKYSNTARVATSQAGNVAQQINSNVNNATQTEFSAVQSITKDAQTGKVAISDTVKKYNSGVATDAKAVAGSAVAAIGATAVGISLAKTIDSTLYNANPDFWDERGMQGLNPETWATITAGENDLGSKLFNFVFQIDETTGNPTAYIDEKTFAYMTAYMIDKGVFSTGHSASYPDIGTGSIAQPINFGTPEDYTIVTNDDKIWSFETTSGTVSACSLLRTDTTPEIANILFASDDSNAAIQRYVDGEPAGSYPLLNHYTYDNKTVYYTVSTSINGVPMPNNNNYSGTMGDFGVDAWVTVYGDIGTTSGVAGITEQTGQTQFDASGIDDPTDIDAVLSALQTQLSDLWDNRIEISPDGDTVLKYIPVGFPTGGTGTEPTTIGATKTDLAPDISGEGQNATEELIKTLIDMIQNPKQQNGMESDTTTPTKPVDPNGDPRGSGESPAIVTPIGTASALWKIYNPSQTQLDTFGGWLWSSNFVDQLLKLFNDPMQAIIGLHKVYVTPPISGSGPIKVGYLVSNANANYVSGQYTDFDCGSVDMREYFNNVFDYDPFTKITIYLPFIGFRQLNVSDVMRGSINVKYTIDVLTGTCLATISVTRDLNTCVLYTFAGNCAVQYPVSSGSYVGIVTGLLGIAGGIAGTIASGGALAPALMGTGASIGAMHTNIEHSGNVSANAGAMGPKKPYIIIERPQTKIPVYGDIIEGKPQNETVILGTLSGHVRVKAAEYNGFNCTANELNRIKDLLSSGIVV